MNRIGVLQGTCLGIYINLVCAFWNYSPPLNCRFCTTGQNVGANEARDKAVSDVIETCRAAREESGATFVHLNGGFQGSRGIDWALPYVKAIKEEVGMLVGVQLAPERDFSRYDELIGIGVDHLSFCLELMDPEWFARVCPGKARVHGQQLFLDAIAYCAQRMPRGAVSGEIIAGIEPMRELLRRSIGSPVSEHSRLSASSVRPLARIWKTRRHRPTRKCAGSWSASTRRAAATGFRSAPPPTSK